MIALGLKPENSIALKFTRINVNYFSVYSIFFKIGYFSCCNIWTVLNECVHIGFWNIDFSIRYRLFESTFRLDIDFSTLVIKNGNMLPKMIHYTLSDTLFRYTINFQIHFLDTLYTFRYTFLPYLTNVSHILSHFINKLDGNLHFRNLHTEFSLRSNFQLDFPN